MPQARRHTLREWVVATRPWSFPASAMPVAVAVTYLWACGFAVKWWLGLLALVGIVVVHAAGNVWSDCSDYRRGVDAADTFGVRTLVDGVFTMRQMLTLSIGLQAVAIAIGLTLVWLTGLPLLWIGMAGIALSLLYPPLKYLALGDVVILLCYAVLPMLGTSFIATGSIQTSVLWLAVPVGSITVAILHVNNARDIATDRRAGIHTFPLLTGAGVARWVYVFEVLMPYAWMVLIVVLGRAPWTTSLALLSLPVAWGNARTMLRSRREGTGAIATLDEGTAQLQLLFSLLLVVAFVVARFV